MRLDVLLGESRPVDVQGRVVVVIDVFRAATTVATALSNGARAVIPCETLDEVARLAATIGDRTARLGGERNMRAADGFHFGNSPGEYSAEAVAGRTILFSSTNGSRMLVASQQSRACFFAGFVNASATVEEVVAALPDASGLLMVCAGQDQGVALEDVVLAGRIVREVGRSIAGEQRTDCGTAGPDAVELGDAARIAMTVEEPYRSHIAALSQDAAHAQSLKASGFEADLDICLSLDIYDRAVRYQDRQLRLTGHRPDAGGGLVQGSV